MLNKVKKAVDMSAVLECIFGLTTLTGCPSLFLVQNSRWSAFYK